ncbi:MAG TPA: universal stress protein [Paraburkholderia sp.]|jgi:nucleotide-binding universal stress UspA family protein|nr:universal stress protein [Paraburkholderia sp.]
MSYKTLLVHLDTSQRAPARLDVALSLAREFGAHVTGMFATYLPDPRSFYVMAGSAEYFEAHRRIRDERQDAIEELFRAGLAHANVEGDWRAATGYADTAVAQASRYADLVIVGQADLDDPEAFVGENFPENLVMSCGRPVLIVPYAGAYDPIGRRALIAWDGSREAARAVHDALPMLARAERVTVVHVSTDATPGRSTTRDPCGDLAAALARHGVHAQVAAVASDDSAAGDALLSYGADGGYDLLVMGAYGHARWQERVLGGATHTLFESMTFPVLMSH